MSHPSATPDDPSTPRAPGPRGRGGAPGSSWPTPTRDVGRPGGGGRPPELAIARATDELRLEAHRFLRRFGLLSAAWSVLLGLAAPVVAHPQLLWTAIGVHVAWAVGSLWVRPVRAWWWGWFLLALALESVVPAIGTAGWSITGGSIILVLAGVALSGRRGWVAATVAALSAVVLVRALSSPAWSVANAVATTLVFAFGAVALTWMVRRIASVVAERDALQAQLSEVRTAAARATERAEAGARLHDTVLQHLSAVHHAPDLADARRNAGRAANDLRQFLRVDRARDATLRAALQDVVTGAADGVSVSVSVVGDRPIDPAADLLLAATVEAVRNAARHGAAPIRVHAEITEGGPAQVWVADQGDGFDLDHVAPDRLGVTESIVARLERAGGSADLTVGETTEWALVLPAPGVGDRPSHGSGA